jgi:hypothetical protein
MSADSKEKSNNEILISIRADVIDPQNISVRAGSHIVWQNETNEACEVVFSNPTCPFNDQHHECRYPVPANGKSKAYPVSGSFLHEPNQKVIFQYAVHFGGRPHRGTPRIIVSN